VNIYKNRRFSDHAPLTVDYAFDLGGMAASSVSGVAAPSPSPPPPTSAKPTEMRGRR
jgi:hypothetical protein